MKLNAIPTQDGSKRNPFKIKKLLAGKPMNGWLMQVVENLGVLTQLILWIDLRICIKLATMQASFIGKENWLAVRFLFWSRIGSRNYNSISSIRY